MRRLPKAAQTVAERVSTYETDPMLRRVANYSAPTPYTYYHGYYPGYFISTVRPLPRNRGPHRR